MPRPDRKQKAQALLDRFGTTLAKDMGIKLERESPSAFFQLLVFSLLSSARIGWAIAIQAFLALKRKGWTTAKRMHEATWEDRTVALNRSGYARYDESTSRMLGDSSKLLLDKYGGDLRRLREAAERDPARERQLLKEFKGIGDVGVDIFFREVQVVWDEIRPFADRKVLQAAETLGLGRSVEELARLTGPNDLPRLLEALARCQLEKAFDVVEDMATRRQIASRH